MRARYADYRAGKVAEDQMCGEMVTMHKGISESVMIRAATKYFNNAFPGKIFPRMRELIRRLHDTGCEVWAVSSSNEWVIRAAMKHFEIPEDRILSSAAKIDDGIITSR